ncbi:cytochrome c oxidase assembly protein [Oceanobacillus sp. J11TS1]|uniref:cytochrome c oxidase assembly protein n=1 Tax=Oceanobacillus sp. J11TS1 TaxID=2807191 RepID=UPI001FD5B7BA|nr:cytochrome c oxidase assembly protein [Oceanobacillus sp. J11TS1]
MAGYVFTIAVLYIDPIRYRYSYTYRTVVFIIALAGHGILSKYIYAFPPEGIPKYHAEIGAQVMYYGGDIIDIVLITILFYHWYQTTNPDKKVTFQST